MNSIKCGFIESICAELIGTFLISSILLTGSTLHSIKTYHSYQYHNDTWKVHDFLSGHLSTKLSNGNARSTELVFAYGLMLTAVVNYTIHISGGHLNPAVTLGAVVCGYISIIPAVCYMVAQIVGALLGEVTAKLIVLKQKPVDLARSEFVAELLASFLLVSVFLSVTDPRKFGNDVGSAPLAIGLTAIAMAWSESNYMNPAMSLATSMHYEDFAQDWIYWISPLLGGLTAGIVYWALARYHDSTSVRIDYSKSSVAIKV